MKQLLLLPLLLLTACATNAPKRITALPAVPAGRPVSSDGLRTAEQLRQYRLGRYVDARDPLVMHEGHPVYRIETNARWDLRANNRAPQSRRDVIESPTVSANDAVVAEVNKQRNATRVFTEQTAALNQRLSELGQVVGQTQEVAKQNLELKRDVAVLRQHLTALEGQLRERKAVAPAPSPEDKW